MITGLVLGCSKISSPESVDNILDIRKKSDLAANGEMINSAGYMLQDVYAHKKAFRNIQNFLVPRKKQQGKSQPQKDRMRKTMFGS